MDDILFVTKGTEQEHVNILREVMKMLDDVNLQLKGGKHNYAHFWGHSIKIINTHLV